jgi:protein-S-isoprenylcysteine O-methyltransferase Ste14
MMLCSLVLGGGSLVLFGAFAPLGRRSLLSSLGLGWPAWSEPWLLGWDALLSLGFFVQHSGMVRESCQSRWFRWVPRYYRGALYSMASGVALLLGVGLWQPSSVRVYALGGPFDELARGIGFAGVALILWGTLALGSFDIFGLRAIRERFRVSPAETPCFVVRGPYRWVRHPLYTGILLIIWSSPDVSADRLLFNLLWSGWIYLGTYWEEADLMRTFGEPYRDYRRRVGRLVPRPTSK